MVSPSISKRSGSNSRSQKQCMLGTDVLNFKAIEQEMSGEIGLEVARGQGP